jgi:hypothetical protein
VAPPQTQSRTELSITWPGTERLYTTRSVQLPQPVPRDDVLLRWNARTPAQFRQGLTASGAMDMRWLPVTSGRSTDVSAIPADVRPVGHSKFVGLTSAIEMRAALSVATIYLQRPTRSSAAAAG